MSTRQADALRRILAENDLAQVDLAAAAHVNKNTLTNILKGGPTSTPVLERLTEAVNVIRRKRRLPEMDVAEWLASPTQAEALRRTRAADAQFSHVQAIVQQLVPTIVDLVDQRLGVSGGSPVAPLPIGIPPDAQRVPAGVPSGGFPRRAGGASPRARRRRAG